VRFYLVALSFLASTAQASFNFSSCKTYEVSGWDDCAKSTSFQDCKLVIAKGTRSEIQAKIFQKLNPDTVSFSKFNGKFITARVRVRDLTDPTFEILKPLKPVIDSQNTKAVRCIDR